MTTAAQLRGGEKMPTSGASGGRSHQTNSQAYFSIAVERGRLAWYACAYFAGLRRGDLLRLCWGDIDFHEMTITVKGGKSGRVDVVPLAADLAEILTEARRTAPEGVQRVFPQEVTAKTRRRDFERAGIEAKDERGRVVDLHSLRGTLATDLARAGVPHLFEEFGMLVCTKIPIFRGEIRHPMPVDREGTRKIIEKNLNLTCKTAHHTRY